MTIHFSSLFLPASDIPVLKEVEALTEPAVFNMVRFVVAAIPFVPFAVRAFGDRRVRNAGLELGVWVSLAYLAQAIGLLSSDAGRASFITAFTVHYVFLFHAEFILNFDCYAQIAEYIL